MKKVVLKKWLEVVLIIIDIIAFICLASDSDNLINFCIVHLIASIIFIIVSYILIKYGRD